MAHYDLLLGNGCLSGLSPCLIAFLLVPHYDLLLGNGCLSGWPWSMFNSISSCGTLRFEPWFRPSFPFILALWAFISLHFGLVGLHFLSFWPFRGRLLGPPPQVAKNGPFAQRPYNGFISAVTGSILQFLAFWAFISLHFGLVGLHFLAFWPCGPSFPLILAFSGSAPGPPPTSCQKWPVCPTSLQWIYQRRDRLHFAVFSILGLHFLAFWPCGPSFPCILALWAFISLHFGLVGLHFLSFWPFRGRLLGPPPQVAKNCPFAQRPYNGFISAVTGPILQFLAFWAFISLHFGLVGLHFLAFWPCGAPWPTLFCSF